MRKNWIISNGNVSVICDKIEKSKSGLAIKIYVDERTFWLPVSQIDYREWSNVVEVPVWLAESKGLV